MSQTNVPTSGVRIIASGPTTGEAGEVLMTRNGTGLQMSVDGGAPTDIGGGQNPANVNITGGSITGVNTATRSTQGAMSPVDKAYLDDFDGWKKAVYATMIAAVPNLTGFNAYDLGFNTSGFNPASIPGPCVDANVEGGGVTAPTGAFGTATSAQFGVSIFQNMPAGNYAFAWEGKITSNAGGEQNQCGVAWQIGTNTARMFIGAVNATSPTKFLFQFQTNAASTNVQLGTFDTNRHTHIFTDDGTTLNAFTDFVQSGSTATRTNVPLANPMSPYIFASASGKIVVNRIAYGFVKA